jgi:ATP-dependent helicase/nuclease subunit A
VRQVAPYGEIELWRDGDQARHDGATADEPDPLPLAEPHWLRAAVDPEPEPEPPIRPSSALTAADRTPRAVEASRNTEARLRGTIVHALLERLPALPNHRREGAARAFVAARAPKLRPEERAAMVAGALKVLAHEALAPLFGPGSRAEAPIAGRLGQNPVFGQIDRLVVTETEVLIADFKTSARPPAPEKPLPEAYVGQLALYRHLLGEIYPNRPVRAFLVWTAGPEIRELSPEELDGALARITGL